MGLANPLPSISGAEPWTASKIEASFPMFPEGVKPRPPIKPADKSERMSPYLYVRVLHLRDCAKDHFALNELCQARK